MHAGTWPVPRAEDDKPPYYLRRPDNHNHTTEATADTGTDPYCATYNAQNGTADSSYHEPNTWFASNGGSLPADRSAAAGPSLVRAAPDSTHHSSGGSAVRAPPPYHYMEMVKDIEEGDEAALRAAIEKYYPVVSPADEGVVVAGQSMGGKTLTAKESTAAAKQREEAYLDFLVQCRALPLKANTALVNATSSILDGDIVNLNDENLRSAGLQAASTVLARNTRLKVLLLRNNHLDNDGVMFLVKELLYHQRQRPAAAATDDVLDLADQPLLLEDTDESRKEEKAVTRTSEAGTVTGPNPQGDNNENDKTSSRTFRTVTAPRINGRDTIEIINLSKNTELSLSAGLALLQLLQRMPSIVFIDLSDTHIPILLQRILYERMYQNYQRRKQMVMNSVSELQTQRTRVSNLYETVGNTRRLQDIEQAEQDLVQQWASTQYLLDSYSPGEMRQYLEQGYVSDETTLTVNGRSSDASESSEPVLVVSEDAAAVAGADRKQERAVMPPPQAQRPDTRKTLQEQVAEQRQMLRQRAVAARRQAELRETQTEVLNLLHLIDFVEREALTEKTTLWDIAAVSRRRRYQNRRDQSAGGTLGSVTASRNLGASKNSNGAMTSFEKMSYVLPPTLSPSHWRFFQVAVIAPPSLFYSELRLIQEELFPRLNEKLRPLRVAVEPVIALLESNPTHSSSNRSQSTMKGGNSARPGSSSTFVRQQESATAAAIRESFTIYYCQHYDDLFALLDRSPFLTIELVGDRPGAYYYSNNSTRRRSAEKTDDHNDKWTEWCDSEFDQFAAELSPSTTPPASHPKLPEGIPLSYLAHRYALQHTRYLLCATRGTVNNNPIVKGATAEDASTAKMDFYNSTSYSMATRHTANTSGASPLGSYTNSVPPALSPLLTCDPALAYPDTHKQYYTFNAIHRTRQRGGEKASVANSAGAPSQTRREDMRVLYQTADKTYFTEPQSSINRTTLGHKVRMMRTETDGLPLLQEDETQETHDAAAMLFDQQVRVTYAELEERWRRHRIFKTYAVESVVARYDGDTNARTVMVDTDASQRVSTYGDAFVLRDYPFTFECVDASAGGVVAATTHNIVLGNLDRLSQFLFRRMFLLFSLHFKHNAGDDAAETSSTDPMLAAASASASAVALSSFKTVSRSRAASARATTTAPREELAANHIRGDLGDVLALLSGAGPYLRRTSQDDLSRFRNAGLVREIVRRHHLIVCTRALCVDQYLNHFADSFQVGLLRWRSQENGVVSGSSTEAAPTGLDSRSNPVFLEVQSYIAQPTSRSMLVLSQKLLRKSSDSAGQPSLREQQSHQQQQKKNAKEKSARTRGQIEAERMSRLLKDAACNAGVVVHSVISGFSSLYMPKQFVYVTAFYSNVNYCSYVEKVMRNLSAGGGGTVPAAAAAPTNGNLYHVPSMASPEEEEEQGDIRSMILSLMTQVLLHPSHPRAGSAETGALLRRAHAQVDLQRLRDIFVEFLTTLTAHTRDAQKEKLSNAAVNRDAAKPLVVLFIEGLEYARVPPPPHPSLLPLPSAEAEKKSMAARRLDSVAAFFPLCLGKNVRVVSTVSAPLTNTRSYAEITAAFSAADASGAGSVNVNLVRMRSSGEMLLKELEARGRDSVRVLPFSAMPPAPSRPDGVEGEERAGAGLTTAINTEVTAQSTLLPDIRSWLELYFSADEIEGAFDQSVHCHREDWDVNKVEYLHFLIYYIQHRRREHDQAAAASQPQTSVTGAVPPFSLPDLVNRFPATLAEAAQEKMNELIFHFGRELVRRLCGVLLASRGGLSEAELYVLLRSVSSQGKSGTGAKEENCDSQEGSNEISESNSGTDTPPFERITPKRFAFLLSLLRPVCLEVPPSLFDATRPSTSSEYAPIYYNGNNSELRYAIRSRAFIETVASEFLGCTETTTTSALNTSAVLLRGSHELLSHHYQSLVEKILYAEMSALRTNLAQRNTFSDGSGQGDTANNASAQTRPHALFFNFSSADPQERKAVRELPHHYLMQCAAELGEGADDRPAAASPENDSACPTASQIGERWMYFDNVVVSFPFLMLVCRNQLQYCYVRELTAVYAFRVAQFTRLQEKAQSTTEPRTGSRGLRDPASAAAGVSETGMDDEEEEEPTTRYEDETEADFTRRVQRWREARAVVGLSEALRRLRDYIIFVRERTEGVLYEHPELLLQTALAETTDHDAENTQPTVRKSSSHAVTNYVHEDSRLFIDNLRADCAATVEGQNRNRAHCGSSPAMMMIRGSPEPQDRTTTDDERAPENVTAGCSAALFRLLPRNNALPDAGDENAPHTTPASANTPFASRHYGYSVVKLLFSYHSQFVLSAGRDGNVLFINPFLNSVEKEIPVHLQGSANLGGAIDSTSRENGDAALPATQSVQIENLYLCDTNRYLAVVTRERCIFIYDTISCVLVSRPLQNNGGTSTENGSSATSSATFSADNGPKERAAAADIVSSVHDDASVRQHHAAFLSNAAKVRSLALLRYFHAPISNVVFSRLGRFYFVSLESLEVLVFLTETSELLCVLKGNRDLILTPEEEEEAAGGTPSIATIDIHKRKSFLVVLPDAHEERSFVVILNEHVKRFFLHNNNQNNVFGVLPEDSAEAWELVRRRGDRPSSFRRFALNFNGNRETFSMQNTKMPNRLRTLFSTSNRQTRGRGNYYYLSGLVRAQRCCRRTKPPVHILDSSTDSAEDGQQDNDGAGQPDGDGHETQMATVTGNAASSSDPDDEEGATQRRWRLKREAEEQKQRAALAAIKAQLERRMAHVLVTQPVHTTVVSFPLEPARLPEMEQPRDDSAGSSSGDGGVSGSDAQQEHRERSSSQHNSSTTERETEALTFLPLLYLVDSLTGSELAQFVVPFPGNVQGEGAPATSADALRLSVNDTLRSEGAGPHRYEVVDNSASQFSLSPDLNYLAVCYNSGGSGDGGEVRSGTVFVFLLPWPQIYTNSSDILGASVSAEAEESTEEGAATTTDTPNAPPHRAPALYSDDSSVVITPLCSLTYFARNGNGGTRTEDGDAAPTNRVSVAFRHDSKGIYVCGGGREIHYYDLHRITNYVTQPSIGAAAASANGAADPSADLNVLLDCPPHECDAVLAQVLRLFSRRHRALRGDSNDASNVVGAGGAGDTCDSDDIIFPQVDDPDAVYVTYQPPLPCTTAANTAVTTTTKKSKVPSSASSSSATQSECQPRRITSWTVPPTVLPYAPDDPRITSPTLEPDGSRKSLPPAELAVGCEDGTIVLARLERVVS